MTSAMASASRTTNPTVYAFQTPSVGSYFFQTTSAKACCVWTMHAMACAFQMTSARAFAFWTQRAKAYLPTRDCASTFRTTLVSAHAAPNMRRPCVCALDDDGHCISLRVDECHSLAFSSKLRCWNCSSPLWRGALAWRSGVALLRGAPV